ncbi:MAG: hypothetical protein LWW98_04540 [Deltaproteobacteria bacterium]|nr:hypothetical protein [Deltaproteobacteria bacterium]
MAFYEAVRVKYYKHMIGLQAIYFFTGEASGDVKERADNGYRLFIVQHLSHSSPRLNPDNRFYFSDPLLFS